jgi:hypothetical protein
MVELFVTSGNRIQGTGDREEDEVGFQIPSLYTRI